jgi:hypothetical protein
MRKLYVTGICTLVMTAFLFSFCEAQAAQSALAAVPSPTKTGSTYKSYREWKNTMVGAAELRIQKIKQTLELQRQASLAQGRLNLDPNLKNKLSKEQLQATIASELTINDYFIGYLNKQPNVQQAIDGVAGKLSSAEVAELMSAYAYNFNKTSLQPLKSASDATPKADQN